MLPAKTEDLGSRCDLMVWMPWQSVHTGASQFPRATASPWMLCAYCCFTLLWHLAQVPGTLGLWILDLGSLAGRISWLPWQSVQTAALVEPAATALPCTLCW